MKTEGLDLARIKALCFDVDGTLHDTDDQFALHFARWLKPFQIFTSKSTISRLARQLVMFTETPANFLFGIPDRLGLDDEISGFGDWLYQKGLGKEAHPFRLIDGVKEMLDELHKVYPLSVVSARGERSTYRFLEEFDIKDHFISIATSQTCRHTKPYPDPVIWAAEKMDTPVENCLMIGDTSVDIEAGIRAGAQTVGVCCGFGSEAELVQSGANLVIHTTSDLKKILYKY